LAFDDPVPIIFILVVVALILYSAFYSGRNKRMPRNPSSGFRTLGYILVILGILLFFFDFLFFFPMVIIGVLLVWFDRAPKKRLARP
jgi:hypothetical protein